MWKVWLEMDNSMKRTETLLHEVVDRWKKIETRLAQKVVKKVKRVRKKFRGKFEQQQLDRSFCGIQVSVIFCGVR